MSTALTIYTAKRIETMYPYRPSVEAVGVRDGRVVGVGTVDELAGWGEHTVDGTFADKVLMPGMVEAHAHVHAGAMWRWPYVGWFERRAPDGTMQAGLRSKDAVIARLKQASEAMADPAEPLIGWGLDPIYYPPGVEFTARDLDRVSPQRPIFVQHASGHVAVVNSALMRQEGIGPDTDVDGVLKDADGRPTGVLQEVAAMGCAPSMMGTFMTAANDELAIRTWAAEARNAGVTALGELASANIYTAGMPQRWANVVNDPDFPARVSILACTAFGGPADPTEAAEYVTALAAQQTDKLRYPGIKLVIDGSPQGFTACFRFPGYFNGAPQGIWNIDPHELPRIAEAFHRAGLIIHCHCNGSLAVDAFLDAIEHALTAAPRFDHRHTVQHSQFSTPDQYRRMRALGMCVNVFSNHIYYWGDQHASMVVGPDRADGMEAAATALREGVPLSLHTDAPITPLGGLHSAWCAVNRISATGRVYGQYEKIGVPEALQAVTIGGAYQHKWDAEIGSIEPGKFADFAVLEQDPLAVDPSELRDIEIWGTVVGGVPRPAPGNA
ncbi:amidohydrolase [Mycolicibacterium palauense]|uniref:amidohydrolase n=1 Tax=Mycolicibacterium palauense TaxID=2034511 RepID=UPI000BFEDDF8|nr:amidohydrolase [Mycolicibacterium palauense]